MTQEYTAYEFVRTEGMSQQDELRWTAVERRDQAANGLFVYSVRTTGVYCRPSCGARPALRRNVQFHDSCEAAENAGFRPCKRCRPNEISPAERQAAAVQAACRSIETAESAPELKALASAAGLSKFHFLRMFRKVTGVTPRQYAERWRAERVQTELRAGSSVTEAIYDAGFQSSSRFYEAAPGMLGMTPSQFRKGGAGVKIRYTVGQSSLGLVMIAATEKGICSVRFGEASDALIAELKENFPAAAIEAAGAELEEWAREVVGFIDRPRERFPLPLDIQGTAFQQRVWAALRDVPPGQTVTYSQLAARTGNGAAVRAVGSACGANPVAVIVPCHRAVRADGSLSGYRWGVERKRQLLEKERGD
jgi:AraC family transcriptional regulator of adaptative response/methylated-DNA-[protein]-cysteine methyltransferase